MLFAALPCALAATVQVETSVAVEVRIDGVPVVRTFGASEVSLPDVTPGPHEFTVWRDEKPRSITAEVPATGVMRLMIGDEDLQVADAVQSAVPGSPPKVEIRATQGQRFAILVDGKRTAVVGSDQPLVLDSLGTGSHTLELRTPDLLVVWVRGTLDLQAGDELVVTAAEGRMIEVFGRPEAWRPAQAGNEAKGSGGAGTAGD